MVRPEEKEIPVSRGWHVPQEDTKTLLAWYWRKVKKNAETDGREIDT